MLLAKAIILKLELAYLRKWGDYMYRQPDYLMHYGVLGMKWGQRRAKHYANKAKNAKVSAKEWDEIASYQRKKGASSKKVSSYKKYASEDRIKSDKYANKSKQIEQKHMDRAGSKETYNRVKNQSTAKLLGKSAIIGTYGTLNYERARAKGYSRGRSFLAGYSSEVLNNLTGGFRSIAEPRITAATKETKK